MNNKKVIWFDKSLLHTLSMDKFNSEIEQLYISTYGVISYRKSKYAISCMVGNIIYSFKHECYLYVSRDKKKYKPEIENGKLKESLIGYKAVINLLTMLEDYGIIKSTKGFISFDQDENTKQITVLSGESGYIELTEIGEQLIMSKVDIDAVNSKPRTNVLILKDKEKNEIEYEDTPETQKMIDLVNKYNQFMSNQEVLDVEGTRLHTALARVFSRGDVASPDHLFSYGGRFYTEGTNYQQFPSIDRKMITINGENVYELDFRSIHISMYCSMEGITLPEGYDVYSQYDENNYVLDADMVQMVTCTYKQDYNPYREFQKLAWLILINCGKRDKTRMQNRRLAISTLEHKLKEDRELPEHLQRFTGLKSVNIEGVVSHIENTFSIARGLLYSDKGIELMKSDSDMMQQILLDCVQEGIPVLCVHDSVVVPQSGVGKVMEIMKAAYGFICGRTDNCVITIK